MSNYCSRFIGLIRILNDAERLSWLGLHQLLFRSDTKLKFLIGGELLFHYIAKVKTIYIPIMTAYIYTLLVLNPDLVYWQNQKDLQLIF